MLRTYIRRHKALLAWARFFKQKTVGPKYHVLTLDECFGLASDWADLLPRNFDCIVGVPRSGALVANVIASKLNLPLSTPDDFIMGNVWFGKDNVTKQIRRVLVVEDAVNEGRALKEAVSKLQLYNPELEIKTGCLNAPFSPEMRDFIDYAYINAKNMPAQWHMYSFFKNRLLAVDLDGVLIDEVRGGPLLIPSFGVEAVVSARLEAERYDTAKQLRHLGLEYRELILFPLPKSKRTYRNVVKFKADAAKSLGVDWFWESDPILAKGISERLGKPVYCPSNHLIYSPKTKWLQQWRGN